MLAPNQLVSLWDMLQIDAGKLIGLLNKLRASADALNFCGQHQSAFQVPKDQYAELVSEVAEIAQFAASLDLPMGYSMASRFVTNAAKFMAEGADGHVVVNYPHVLELAASLDRLHHLRDEASGTMFLALTVEEARLWEGSGGPIFGQLVEDAFPASTFDLREASKCLGIGRATASVFHLMRATEAAALVLAKKIRAKTKDKSGETKTLGGLSVSLGERIAGMKPGRRKDDWRKAQMFLSDCNRAFRTKTAHPIDKYTDEEARDAFNATGGFLREAAKLI